MAKVQQENSDGNAEGYVLPHNTAAEQSLLGAILLDNKHYEQVSDYLLPQHFAVGLHGKIFEAIRILLERGLLADPITLNSYFGGNQELQAVGGDEYFIKLVDSVTILSSVSEYGKIIYDHYIRRSLISIGEETIRGASSFELHRSATYEIEQTEMKLFNLASTNKNERSVISFDNAISDVISIAESAKDSAGIAGITTGFIDLDSHLGGLHKSDLIILAGRPSMGKTALATNIAYNAALAARDGKKNGGGVAFFSLEMSSEQLATRVLAQEACISSHKIRRGQIKQDDVKALVEISRKLLKIPLFIDDTPALTTSALRTRARRLKRQHGIGLVVVDYLQLMQPTDLRRNEGRVNEVSEITRSLKALAKELDVPVIALSQLSRAVEQRDDKKPQLADLRESGSIEQDADVVMFIFREEYYEARREPTDVNSQKYIDWKRRMNDIYNVAEVIIAKQRHGPIGTVRLFFDGELTKFGNFAKRTVE